jgi:hypothetical protein
MIVSYEVGPTSDHFRPPNAGYYAPRFWVSIEKLIKSLGFSRSDTETTVFAFASCPPLGAAGCSFTLLPKLCNRQPLACDVYWPAMFHVHVFWPISN